MQNAREVPAAGVRRKKRWSQHPTVRFFFVVGVLLGGYLGYGYVTGPSRITDRLHARLAGNSAEVHIAVTTKFPPEVFHIRIFQQLGSMRGVEGSTTKLYSVTPASVRLLSRYYWIRRIDLAPNAKGVGKRRP